jgi:transcriptional regulator with XRE-family HTH domain
LSQQHKYNAHLLVNPSCHRAKIKSWGLKDSLGEDLWDWKNFVSTTYEQFAENLMRLTLQRGSIANVCRGTGINRQQYNKYLSGKVLPNDTTLSKLAHFFGLTEHELFLGVQSRTPEAIQPSFNPLNEFVNSSMDSTFAEGCYTFYMPWILSDEYVTRGVMLLKRTNGLLTFTRHLKLRDAVDETSPQVAFEMNGLVMQNGKQVTFLGREAAGWNTYIASYFFNIGERSIDNICAGLALVFSHGSNPFIASVLLKREDTTPDLESGIGIFNIKSEIIPPQIKHIFANHKSEMGFLRCIEFSKSYSKN